MKNQLKLPQSRATKHNLKKIRFSRFLFKISMIQCFFLLITRVILFINHLIVYFSVLYIIYKFHDFAQTEIHAIRLDCNIVLYSLYRECNELHTKKYVTLLSSALLISSAWVYKLLCFCYTYQQFM